MQVEMCIVICGSRSTPSPNVAFGHIQKVKLCARRKRRPFFSTRYDILLATSSFLPYRSLNVSLLNVPSFGNAQPAQLYGAALTKTKKITCMQILWKELFKCNGTFITSKKVYDKVLSLSSQRRS